MMDLTIYFLGRLFLYTSLLHILLEVIAGTKFRYFQVCATYFGKPWKVFSPPAPFHQQKGCLFVKYSKTWLMHHYRVLYK